MPGVSTSAPEPLIVTVAPNGARKTRADHPALPITPDELARTAADCRAAGAAMIHLHVRDSQGRHSLGVEAYREAIVAIRDAVGDELVIQATSEAVGIYGAAEQMAMVRALRPEAVSLAIRELVPDAAAEQEAAAFFAWLKRESILPQFILYSAEEMARFNALVERGIVPAGRHFLLFVLGRYSQGQVSEPQDLLPFVAANGQGHRWAVCAFGARETTCALTAACLDGHARVGFENNLLLPDGRVAPDNAALVAATVAGARTIARPLADAAAARALMADAG